MGYRVARRQPERSAVVVLALGVSRRVGPLRTVAMYRVVCGMASGCRIKGLVRD